MKRLLLYALITLATIWMSGCASTGTGSAKAQRGLRIVQEKGGAEVSSELATMFTEALADDLFREGRGFAPGNDLTLHWRALNIESGNRALRMVGVGKGGFNVKATLRDKVGHVVAAKEIRGSQTLGFSSGLSHAVHDAAAETAAFTREASAGL